MLAGQIGKPHGTTGEVYVVAISDDPARFEPGSVLERSDGRSLVVERCRRSGNRLLVKFSGVDTRTEAEGLRGSLYVAAEHLRALEEDEFWEHDLIGCRVVGPGGDPLGDVGGIERGPGQDRLRVDTPDGVRLVPLVAAIVVDVDVDARRITVDAPPGLLD